MPIHDQGYRRWEGKLSGHTFRWATITATGIGQALGSRKMWLFLAASLLPAIGMAFVAYAFLMLGDVASKRGAGDAFLEAALQRFGPEYYFQLVRSQSFFVMLLAAGLGARLVSRDQETRALEIYLSRPVTKLDYIVGKFGVIASFGLVMTLVPFFLLYAVVVLCQSDLRYLQATYRIPLALAGTSLVVTFVTSWVIVGLSSLTARHRYVTIGWVAFYVGSLILGGVLQEVSGDAGFQLLAYPRNIERVALALLGTGMPGFEFPWVPSAALLGVCSVAGFLLVYRRVRAVEVVRG